MTSATVDSRADQAEPLGFSGPRARQIRTDDGTVWFEGFVRNRSPEQLVTEALAATETTVASWLNGLDGFYRIVVLGRSAAFAACDTVRSYPLIWGRDGTGLPCISASGPALEAHLNLGPSDIDPGAVVPVTLSGFTIGNETLYRDVQQIGPGEYLWLLSGEPEPKRYTVWDAWNVSAEFDPDALPSLHEKLIDDLIRDADGRQILVPLSAGLDSRFIASGLKAAGYDNVLTVAYGQKGNREAETSREIARRLGYEWRFVPYTNGALSRMFRSDDYAAFKNLSDSLTSVHFPQEYHAIDTLLRQGDINRDTVVVNGQSGDFITGNHVPASLFEPPDSEEARLNAIVDGLLNKHYRQWAALRTPERLNTIAEKLRGLLQSANAPGTDKKGAHGYYEFREFWDRQSKYVINGQRLYDHFGLDWRLPLWDRAYMDYWARAPISAKQGQSLYKQALHQANWAGVWRDIPVNPTRIRPLWIKPLRLAAKAAHVFAGRAAWHRFEKRYFEYWMGATCAFAGWPYGTVRTDRRGHHSAIAWHIEDYLNNKGLAWDGSMLEGRAA